MVEVRVIDLIISVTVTCASYTFTLGDAGRISSSAYINTATKSMKEYHFND